MTWSAGSGDAMTLHELYVLLLIAGLVLVVSIIASRLSSRIGLPSLLLFLGLGVAMGEDGLGIHFDDAQLAQNIGTAALAVILVEGGLTTRWEDVRRVVSPAGVLATVGVGVSTSAIAVAAHLLIGLDWPVAFLLGAIVSSTDAAAVFSVLRVLPLPRRVAGILEAESGFNDAPCVILVVLFSQTPFVFSVPDFVATMAWELSAGVAIGLGTGALGTLLLRRVALPASGLYPVAIFSLGLLAFAGAGAAHASGFAAAYLAGLVLANVGLPHRAATRSFAEGVGWLAQIGLFVLLGLLITPHELAGQIGDALIIGLVLVLVARPLSVAASLLPYRVPWREQVFLSWAGLRGAVPIVLATYPIVEGVPEGRTLLDIVFVLVVVYTLVQAPSLYPLARRLRLVRRDAARELLVESAPLDVLAAELLTLTIPPGSGLHAVSILELRLPAPSVVTLVIRDGKTFVPTADSQLKVGDEILVVTTSATREQTERRLRAVGRRGKLAYWFDEYGDPD